MPAGNRQISITEVTQKAKHTHVHKQIMSCHPSYTDTQSQPLCSSWRGAPGRDYQAEPANNQRLLFEMKHTESHSFRVKAKVLFPYKNYFTAPTYLRIFNITLNFFLLYAKWEFNCTDQ